MIITDLSTWYNLDDEEKLTLCKVLVYEYDRWEHLPMLSNVEMYHVKDHPDHLLFSVAGGIFHDWRRVRWNVINYAEKKDWHLALNAMGYLIGIVAFLEYMNIYYKFTLPKDTNLDEPWAKCVMGMNIGG